MEYSQRLIFQRGQGAEVWCQLEPKLYMHWYQSYQEARKYFSKRFTWSWSDFRYTAADQILESKEWKLSKMEKYFVANNSRQMSYTYWKRDIPTIAIILKEAINENITANFLNVNFFRTYWHQMHQPKFWYLTVAAAKKKFARVFCFYELVVCNALLSGSPGHDRTQAPQCLELSGRTKHDHI